MGDRRFLLRFWEFLEQSRDMIRLREKQGRFLDRLVPLVEIRVGVMLSHGDEFNEIAPMSLVDLVAETMRQLYTDERCEEGSAMSGFADFHAAATKQVELKATTSRKAAKKGASAADAMKKKKNTQSEQPNGVVATTGDDAIPSTKGML